MSRHPVIEIANLSKSFGAGEARVTALSDVDVTISTGEVVGLIESFDDKQLPGIADVDPKFLTKDKAGRHVGLPAYFTY